MTRYDASSPRLIKKGALRNYPFSLDSPSILEEEAKVRKARNKELIFSREKQFPP